jgi:hypothetical protein
MRHHLLAAAIALAVSGAAVAAPPGKPGPKPPHRGYKPVPHKPVHHHFPHKPVVVVPTKPTIGFGHKFPTKSFHGPTFHPHHHHHHGHHGHSHGHFHGPHWWKPWYGYTPWGYGGWWWYKPVFAFSPWW